jgi:pimeloyl-ACP methyl ester carboxylesterase
MDWPNLPSGVNSRSVAVNDLTMHILEGGYTPGGERRPLVLLLHGFPELAYSWRKLILPISQAGYHVVAPDQRGYGRTCPQVPKYTDDLAPYRMFNLVRDVVALVHALGYSTAHAIVGHDFGSPLAGFCALIRPDIFQRVACMSAPFPGAPSLPFDVERNPDIQKPRSVIDLAPGFAALDPPRKHYVLYYSTPDANTHMHNPEGGLHQFLRTYFHAKSADVQGHPVPHPLSPDPKSLAELPSYYLMPLHATMPQAVALDAPTSDEVAANTWLPNAELDVYVREFARVGFQGGLNWYRCRTDIRMMQDLAAFAGKTILAPAIFIGGKMDWGVYQDPGGLTRMRQVCTAMNEEDVFVVDGGGHWIMQEQPEAVTKILLQFFRRSVENDEATVSE